MVANGSGIRTTELKRLHCSVSGPIGVNYCIERKSCYCVIGISWRKVLIWHSLGAGNAVQQSMQGCCRAAVVLCNMCNVQMVLRSIYIYINFILLLLPAWLSFGMLPRCCTKLHPPPSSSPFSPFSSFSSFSSAGTAMLNCGRAFFLPGLSMLLPLQLRLHLQLPLQLQWEGGRVGGAACTPQSDGCSLVSACACGVCL